MSALSTTINLSHLARLPQTVREEILLFDTVFAKAAQRIAVTGVRATLLALVAELGRWSYPSMERKFYAWQKAGKLALINHAKCRGCGLPGCFRSSKEHAPAIPEPLIEDLWNRAGANTTRRGVSAAWRAILRDLATGIALPGIGPGGRGTWTHLFQKLHPGRPLPRLCPWGEHNPPPGWSLTAFSRSTRPQIALALEQGGRLNVKKLVWSPTMSTAHLRALEYIVFDDKRLDVLVHVGSDLVEPWCLFAMDVATRMIVAYGVRYRVRREDGTKTSISQQDMAHLIAGLLNTWGAPTADRPMNLLVENAAAAISAELESALTLATNGALTVHRTSMIEGNLWATGWGEKSGNPMGKPWLESAFALMDIEAGNLPGNTGSKWWLKPIDHEEKKAYALDIIRKGASLPLERYSQLQIPFLNQTTFSSSLKDLVDRMNSRTSHRIQNSSHQVITQWRYSDADPEWRDISDLATFPPEIATQLLKKSRTVSESPHTLFHRLYDPQNFTTLPHELAAFLLFDTVKDVQYSGGNILSFKRGTQTFRYYGTEHSAEAGQRYTIKTHFDEPWTFGAHLFDLSGRYVGHLPWDNVTRYGDAVDAAANIKKGRSELKTALNDLARRKHGDGTATQQAINALETNLSLITAERPRPAELPQDGIGAQALRAVHAAIDQSDLSDTSDNSDNTDTRPTNRRRPTPRELNQHLAKAAAPAPKGDDFY
jgi:hypothetical protein